MIILWITGVVFIATQVVLVWASTASPTSRTAGTPRPARPLLPRQPAPGGDLDDHPGRHPRVHRPVPDGDLGGDQVPQLGPQGHPAGRDHRSAVPVGDAVSGPDRKLNTATTWSSSTTCTSSRTRPALIYLKSSDVLHSFFLPQLRIKQDAVPGLTIPVWFDADTSG